MAHWWHAHYVRRCLAANCGSSERVIGIVVHELATNALKFGSFSNNDGCLAGYWRARTPAFRAGSQNGKHARSTLTALPLSTQEALCEVLRLAERSLS